MSKLIDSRLAMLKGAFDVLSANKDKTDTISAMNESIEDLGKTISEIESYLQLQLNQKKGPTQQRNDAAERLIATLLPSGSSMYSYGKKAGDVELCEKTNVPERILRSMRQADLLETSRLYAKLAKDHETELAAYGLPGDKIAALEAMSEAYGTSLKKRHTYAAEAAGHQKAFSVLFRQGNEVLKDHLDKLMEHFRESDPVFYATYRKARVKRNTVGRHRQTPETAATQDSAAATVNPSSVPAGQAPAVQVPVASVPTTVPAHPPGS